MNIDPQASVTFSSLRAGLHSFFAWWRDQLLACFPEHWRERYDALFRVPLLTLGSESWSLTGLDATGTGLSIDPNRPTDESFDLLGKHHYAALENGVNVQLPEGDVLIRHITLPAAAVGRLRSVVRLQLDRLSPFRGDDVSFDCRAVGVSDEGAVEIEVGIASKSTLYGYEQKLRAIGLTPRTFRLPTSPLQFPTKGIPWTKERQRHILVAALGICVWIAAFWFAPSARDAEIADLGGQISYLRSAADKAQAERRQLNHYVLPPEAILAYHEPTLDMLATLAQLLPPDTHLTELTLDNDVVRLKGTAASVNGVETALRKSKIFGAITKLNTSSSSDQNGFNLETRLLPAGAKTQ